MEVGDGIGNIVRTIVHILINLVVLARILVGSQENLPAFVKYQYTGDPSFSHRTSQIHITLLIFAQHILGSNGIQSDLGSNTHSAQKRLLGFIHFHYFKGIPVRTGRIRVITSDVNPMLIHQHDGYAVLVGKLTTIFEQFNGRKGFTHAH